MRNCWFCHFYHLDRPLPVLAFSTFPRVAFTFCHFTNFTILSHLSVLPILPCAPIYDTACLNIPSIWILRPTCFTALSVLLFGQFCNISDGLFTIYHSHQFPDLFVLTFYHLPMSALPFSILANFTILRTCQVYHFTISCDPSGITILHPSASAGFREFPPHIHLYSIYVSDFVGICRVASGRWISYKFPGSNF